MNRAPFGTWESPITSDLAVSGAIPLAGAKYDQGHIYGLEGRPEEGGRSVVVRYDGDRVETLTPEGFNIRSRVHEYGGAAWSIDRGELRFVNFDDQRLYRQRVPGSTHASGETAQLVEPITDAGSFRYADGVPCGDGSYLYVREEHRPDGEPINTIVRFGREGDELVVASGNDFYSSPRVSPDGARVAWLTWHHPNMPWDGTELWAGELTTDGVKDAALVAGGPEESIFQPEFSPGGELYFVSDRTNWWNLYRESNGGVEAVSPLDAEFGAPQWVLGMSTYGFTPAGWICALYTSRGRWQVCMIDPADPQGKRIPIEVPYETISSLSVGDNRALVTAQSADRPTAILELDLIARSWRIVRESGSLAVDPAYLSVPEGIEYESDDGLAVHAWYYPPENPDYDGTDRPPLMVVSHGGPTGSASVGLSYAMQFWTSRGFAVVDVDYRGSTGYGRKYRRALYGEWGIADVEDCVGAARHLVGRGLVDPERLIIRGGSAGGYTTLCALTFHDTFSAGASHYGISDLETLVTETHKFESRYTDSLIGPYPEMNERYRSRSPIHFVDRISCPIILFQGMEDRVVPPDQSIGMYEKLKASGLQAALVTYEGEYHGFRKSENRRHALESELVFYGRVLGFEPAGDLPDIEIANLN